MIKPTVRLYGIRPEMVLCDTIVQGVFNEMGFGCVRTSIVGKKHKDKSLHPVGLAIDYRSKHINSLSIKENILQELKKALPCCDILLEHVGEDQEHFHVEVDDHNDKEFQRDKKIYKDVGEWP